MTHYWSQTMGNFRPSFASDEKHGTVIITDLSSDKLIDLIIQDHRDRRRGPGVGDYSAENFTDEFRIYVWSTIRWRYRLLCNFQYEGE